MAFRDVARGAPWAMGCLCLFAAKLAHSATRAASGARPRIYNFCFGGPTPQSFSASARHGRFVTDWPADPAAIDARRYTARLTLRPAMDDAEILTRAREAHIAVSRPSQWRARRIRAGESDRHLAGTLIALSDIHKPMSLILADRDEATAAVVLKTSPGLSDLNASQRRAVVAAIHTAVLLARRS